MTTTTLTLTETCSGGSHLTFELTGDKQKRIFMQRDELGDPITEEDWESYCRIITKMAKAGRNNQQARALLQAGVVVTV